MLAEIEVLHPLCDGLIAWMLAVERELVDNAVTVKLKCERAHPATRMSLLCKLCETLLQHAPHRTHEFAVRLDVDGVSSVMIDALFVGIEMCCHVLGHPVACTFETGDMSLIVECERINMTFIQTVR